MSRILGMTLATIIGLVALVTPTSADEEGWPPPPPQGDRELSVDLGGWKYKLFDDLLIEDPQVERTVGCIVDLPGDAKLRMFDLKGDEKPTPPDIKTFYLGWAAENGYQMLVESWSGEDEGLTGVLHKPGDGGGIFIFQVDGDEVLWLWDQGHCPIGPLFAAWFDFPKVRSTSEPGEGLRPWTSRADIPDIFNNRMRLRVELDRWEIDSIATDLAGAGERDDEDSLYNLLVAAPDLFATVRHIWFLTYETVTDDDRGETINPWVAWAKAAGLTSVAEGEMKGISFEFFIKSGADGGMLVVLEEESKTNLLAFDGGPSVEAITPILNVAVQAAQAEE